MAEKKVIFRDNQELQGADLNNQQDWLGEAIDHVVVDTIEDESGYAGFGVTKAQSTTVQVAKGRLYKDGAVYARDETVTLDFFNDLPVTTKRQFAIVVRGQTLNTDEQPRNFVVNADTGAAQPQTVAMETDRYCNVEYVRGVESSDPQIPSVDATVLAVAYVLCDTTGVVSVTQNYQTQVKNLSVVGDRVDSIDYWRSVISGSVDTLRTDLANLAKQLLLYVPLSDYQRLVDIVNELYTKVFRPGAYLWYGTDNFLDETLSDTDSNLDSLPYAAVINEGLRFPGGSDSAVTTLQLVNPSDPFVQVDDGFMLPKPSGSRVRHDCSFPDHPWVEDRILQYVFHNATCRHLKHSRWRHCCGPRFKPCPQSLVWWFQAERDPCIHIMSFINESWEERIWREIRDHCNEDSPDWPRHGCDRELYHWRDWVHLPYWAYDFDSHSESGQHIGQSFLNAQDGWLTGVTIYLMKAYYQPLTLVISACDEQGEPDHVNQSIRRVVLDAATLETCVDTPLYAGDIEVLVGASMPGIPRWSSHDILLGYYPYWQHVPVYVYPCRIPIPPTFLQAGRRYTIHLVSTYDHCFAISNKFECYQVHQGHFWHSNDISARLRLWPGDITPKSLRFKLHYAVWGRWGDTPTTGGGLHYTINMQPLQLPGGIGAVEVLARAVIPESCDLSYQVQISGTWYPFKGGDDAPDLASNPAYLPFRIVMSGTTDLMPGVSLTPSQVTLHGGEALQLRHVSNPITVGSAAGNVKIIAKINGFDEDHHDLVASLHVDGARHDDFDVMQQETLADGSLQRTWTFTSFSPTVSSFVVELDGTQDGEVDSFVVAQEIRYATA